MTSARRAEGVQIVCFDLGGVLVRLNRTWSEACGAAGVEVREGSIDGAPARARGELMDLFALGRISEESWLLQLSQVLQGRYTIDELRRIHHVRIAAEYSGAAQLVDDLHQAGVVTACLSNTDASHWTRLLHHDGGRDLPGAPEFPAVKSLRRHFGSHLLGVAKPDPAIYHAFERATDLAGGQILFFDDLTDNIQAARALGWNAEPVDHRAETVPQIRRALARHRLLGA